MKKSLKQPKDSVLIEEFIGDLLFDESGEEKVVDNHKPESKTTENKLGDNSATRSNQSVNQAQKDGVVNSAAQTASSHTNVSADSSSPKFNSPKVASRAADIPVPKSQPLLQNKFADHEPEPDHRLEEVKKLLQRMPGGKQVLKVVDEQQQAVQSKVEQPDVTEPAIKTSQTETTAEHQQQKQQENEIDILTEDVSREVAKAKEMLGEAFQTLIFEVGKLPLAVPLVKLGGIHTFSEEDITEIFGTPDWFKGVIPSEQGNVLLVDTAQLIMPEKYQAIKDELDYKYAILLDDTRWALACTQVREAKSLNIDDIRWSQKGTKKEWFAGMVVQFMCALLEVDALINQLYREGKQRKSK